MRSCSSERCSDLPKATQLFSGGAGSRTQHGKTQTSFLPCFTAPVSKGKPRTREGERLAQQVRGRCWVSLAQPRARLPSCASPSLLHHTSSAYDVSLRLARMPARVSVTPWHKGPLGKSASPGFLGRVAPPAPPPAGLCPRPCHISQGSCLALARCFQNSFTPTLPGVFELFQARELFSE